MSNRYTPPTNVDYDRVYSAQEDASFKNRLIALRDPKICKQLSNNIQTQPDLWHWIYVKTVNFKGVLDKKSTSNNRKDSIGARCYAVLNDMSKFECEHGVELFWDGDKRWVRGFTKGCKECTNKSRGENVKSAFDLFSDEKWENIREKSIKTLETEYGVDNPGKLPQALEAHKAVYDNPARVADINEGIRNTNLERYGVEYTFQIPEARQKGKQTSLERYGYEYAMMNKDVAKKSKENRDKDAIKRILLEHGYHKFHCYIKENFNVTTNILIEDWLGVNSYDKLDFICLECNGVHNRTIEYGSSAIYCPVCDVRDNSASKGELQLRDYLTSIIDSTFIYNNRTILGGKELDIVDVTNKLAFEYCGLYYHKENNPSSIKGKDYHRGKLLKSENEGYQLVTIFEDEWRDKQEIVKDNILRLYNISLTSINSDDLTVVLLDEELSEIFLNENNIYGYKNGGMSYGLVDSDGVIYSVMKFEHFSSDDKTIILQYAEKIGFSVIGSITKLTNSISTNVVWKQDLRWGIGKNWIESGFVVDNDSAAEHDIVTRHSIDRIDSCYIDIVVNEEDYDCIVDEWVYLFERGYDRIWDCGYRWMTKK